MYEGVCVGGVCERERDKSENVDWLKTPSKRKVEDWKKWLNKKKTNKKSPTVACFLNVLWECKMANHLTLETASSSSRVVVVITIVDVIMAIEKEQTKDSEKYVFHLLLFPTSAC